MKLKFGYSDIKYCIKYDTCRRCPQNVKCSKMFKKEQEAKKSKEGKHESN